MIIVTEMVAQRGFKLMPYKFMEKLKRNSVLIGNERCASSSFTDSGEVIVCASHGYGMAQRVLHCGRTYFCCRQCIQDSCDITIANLEEKPRGPWENLME